MEADMNERSTLVLRENSWHARLYRWWQKKDPSLKHRLIPGKPKGYKENLCHYWRVVMIWAPLRVFLRWHPRRISWLFPWVVAAAVVGFGGITAAVILAPGAFLAGLLFVSSVTVGFLLWLVLLWQVDVHQKTLVAFTSHLGSRIWRMIGRPCRAVGRGFEWFLFTDLALQTLYPWVLFLIVTWIALLAMFTSVVLIATGCAFAAVGLLLSAHKLLLHVEEAEAAQPSRVKVDNGPGMIRVTGRFLVAKKHGICPFIEIEK